MGKLKKPLVVVSAVVFLAGAALGVFLYLKKHGKTTVKESAKTQQAIAGTEINVDKDLASVNNTYSDKDAAKFTGAALTYFNKRDYVKMAEVLNKIPDTASMYALRIKYRLMANRYLLESNMDMYLKTREEYKKILIGKSAKDPEAKIALANFEQTFPVNTAAPTITDTSGEGAL